MHYKRLSYKIASVHSNPHLEKRKYTAIVMSLVIELLLF